MKPGVPAAYLFDAYGTLFDVHAAVRYLSADIGPNGDALSALWRAKQLEYSWLRSLMGRHADFWQLTQDALDYALAMHGRGDDPALRARLLSAYETLDPYPDARPLLEALRDAGIPVALLSNGSPPMLASAVRAAGFEELLAGSLSVESVGVFKPDMRVYQLGADFFPGIAPAQIGFVSSNGWDAAGAATFGFDVTWVNRGSLPPERLPDSPTRVVHSLAEIMAR